MSNVKNMQTRLRLGDPYKCTGERVVEHCNVERGDQRWKLFTETVEDKERVEKRKSDTGLFFI